MTLNDLLNCVIDDGISEIRITYLKPSDRIRREGAIAGFEACRGLEPADLRALLAASEQKVQRARQESAHNYWWHSWRHAQILWCADVMSVALLHLDLPCIVPPTARAFLKYAEIFDVSLPDLKGKGDERNQS